MKKYGDIRITIIIPTYNRNIDLERCLESIFINTTSTWEAIILTPEVNDEIKDISNKYPCRLICDESRESGDRKKSLWAIINYGIDLAETEYVVWLNDDCLVLPNWNEVATGYFSNDIGLVVLRASGINNDPEFRVMDSQFGLPCANYGIIKKGIGVRFDEKYSWFYGDADISIEMLYRGKKQVVATEEGLVIHNHKQDATRKENESNPVVNEDIRRYVKKWKYFKRIGDRIQRKNILEILIMNGREVASLIKKRILTTADRELR